MFGIYQAHKIKLVQSHSILIISTDNSIFYVLMLVIKKKEESTLEKQLYS
jgi:hypothetical protein